MSYPKNVRLCIQKKKSGLYFQIVRVYDIFFLFFFLIYELPHFFSNLILFVVVYDFLHFTFFLYVLHFYILFVKSQNDISCSVVGIILSYYYYYYYLFILFFFVQWIECVILVTNYLHCYHLYVISQFFVVLFLCGINISNCIVWFFFILSFTLDKIDFFVYFTNRNEKM